MCGRTACTLAPDDVVRACTYRDDKGHRKRPEWKDAPGGQNYWQSHNVAPTMHTPVLVRSNFDGTKTESSSERVVTPMKWGLTPSWHKGDPYKVPYETNNCRIEGMLEKKTYKVPLQKGNRCVVLSDGYFEWKTTAQGKQPYFFYFPQPEHISYPGNVVKVEQTRDENSLRIKMEVGDEACVLPGLKQEDKPGSVKPDGLSGNLKQEDSSMKVKQETHADIENLGMEEKVSSEKCGDFAKVPAMLDSNSNKSTSLKNENLVLDSIKLSNVEDYNVGDKRVKQEEDAQEIEEKWEGQRLLTMAGIYDVWTPSDGSEPLYSYSVITVPAAADIDWCHHRMPAILSTEKEVSDWLDSRNVDMNKAVSLIKQYKGLVFHPVTKSMNNSRYKSPDCVKPVELGKPKATASSALMMNWLKTDSPAKKSRIG